MRELKYNGFLYMYGYYTSHTSYIPRTANSLPTDVQSCKSTEFADIVWQPSQLVALQVQRLEAVSPKFKGQLPGLVVCFLSDHFLYLGRLLGRHFVTQLLQTGEVYVCERGGVMEVECMCV